MEAVFLKILNMSITASWLVLAVILLRLLLKKAPKWVNGVLWAFVALRLIFPFSIESFLSLIPSAETLPDDFIYTPEPVITSGIPIINHAVNPIIAESLTPAPGASANPTQILSFIAAVIWLAGVGGMLLYMLISYMVLRIKVRERVLAEGNVYLCDKIPTPFIMGLIRPKIYLPSDISGEDKQYVLSHEKAHIKRGDHLWKPLGFILLAVYWFNPILWAAYILLCRDIELACDEKVIKSLGEDVKKPYSLALINYSSPRRMISACPLAFGEVGVRERVKRILNYKKPAFWIVILAAVSCAVVAVCFLTNPQRQKTIASVYEDEGLTEFYNSPIKVWVKKGAFDNDAMNGTGDSLHMLAVWDYVNEAGGIKLAGKQKAADPSTVGAEPDYLIVVTAQYNERSRAQIILCFNEDFTEFWKSPEHGKPEDVYIIEEPEKARRLFSLVMLSIETEYDDDGRVVYGILNPENINNHIEVNSPDARLFNALKSCKFDKSTEIKNFKGFGKLKHQVKITNLCGDDILIGNDGSGAILTCNSRAYRIDYPDFDTLLKETCSFENIPRTASSETSPFGSSEKDDSPQQASGNNLQTAAAPKPNFENVLKADKDSLDPDAFKDFELVSFGGMTFWDAARYELIPARIHDPQWKTLESALDGISFQEAAEYGAKHTLFHFIIGNKEYKNININFYNNEYERYLTSGEKISGEVYSALTDADNIDDVCIYYSDKYYSIEDSTAKETLIKLLIEIVEDSGSALNRIYGMDKLVCANPLLSSCPTQDNTPAYCFESSSSGNGENGSITSFVYSMYTYNDFAEKGSIGRLAEIELSSDEYDSLFDAVLRENGYSVNEFRSAENKAYYIRSLSTDFILSITPGNEVYLAMIPNKKVDWIIKLADITPYSGTAYMDHIFYDIDDDGEEEVCTVSCRPSNVNTAPVCFTVRRNGAVIYESWTAIIYEFQIYNHVAPSGANLRMKFIIDGGKLKLVSEDESGKQRTFDVSMDEYIVDADKGIAAKNIILSENGKVLISTPNKFYIR